MMQTRRIHKYTAICLMICLLLCGCVRKGSAQGYAMNTFYAITVYGANAQHAADKAAEEIARVESLLSISLAESVVHEINASPGKPVALDAETYSLLSGIYSFAEGSNGSFSPVLGAVKALWGFGGETRVPAQGEIASVRAHAVLSALTLDADAHTASLAEGALLDLGAAAKGYAADMVLEKLRTNGVEHALVDLGGSISVCGTRADGEKWRVGVANPRGDGYIAVLSIADTALSTSGDYQQYFFGADGVRYCHILDPKTGAPACSGVVAVTVAYKSAFLADMLSTALFVLGPEDGTALLAKYPGAEALFLTEDGYAVMTDGMRAMLSNLSADWTPA